MANKYKLISEDERKGVWINEIELLDIIKVCYNRNKGLYIKLVADYEYLEGKTFDPSLIGVKKVK